MNIQTKIWKARKLEGITQYNFARFLGISQTRLSIIETGGIPNKEEKAKIEAFLKKYEKENGEV